MTFLARGVWGSLPIVTISGPLWTSFSTSRRILRRSTSKILKHISGDPACLFDETQQDVLGADIFVVEALRLLVCELHDLAGAVRKSFVHK